MPLRPCLHRGCQNLTSESRCELHRGDRARDPYLTGAGARKRLPRPLRRRVLALARHRCQDCGSGTDLHVDHLNGNAEDNRIENLRVRCADCHRRAHRR